MILQLDQDPQSFVAAPLSVEFAIGAFGFGKRVELSNRFLHKRNIVGAARYSE